LSASLAVAIRDPATGIVWSAPGAIHADLMKEVAPNTLIDEGFTTLVPHALGQRVTFEQGEGPRLDALEDAAGVERSSSGD
jgi:hypothetical protein